MTSGVLQRHFELPPCMLEEFRRSPNRTRSAEGLSSYKSTYICCLRETKLVAGLDIERGGYRQNCFPPECRHYGLVFAISSSYAAKIHRFWQTIDRAAVLTLQSYQNADNKPARGNCSIAVINVYAPTRSNAYRQQTS